MQRFQPRPRKSQRHVRAAQARWAADALRRQDDEPSQPEPVDARLPFDLPLACAGGRDLHIEPITGLIAWRAIDQATGKTVHRAALKTLLRQIADELPRTMSLRHLA